MILTFLYQPTVGETMTYIGGTESDRVYGDDQSELTLGQNYTISDIFPGYVHIRVSLKELTGKFNSACFKPLEKSN